MAEPALQLVKTDEVETKALSIVDQAKAVKVIDAETYTQAGEMWKTIRDMMKEVADTFDPIVEQAHKAHKKALEQKAKYYKPLEEAQKGIKRLMSNYDQEQERIRLAEQRRLEEEARKAEEERRLQEAILAEEMGEKEEAQAILEEPVYVAPVVVEKATPKMQGGPVYRTVKKFRITDESLIPRQYLTPDMTKIGGVVRSLGKAANIPGVEVYEERV